jgi:D-aminoacyl-tRNA deacylase
MKVVLQRVKRASVTVDNIIEGEINNGFLVLAAIGRNDSMNDYKYIAEKIVNLRVFEDENGKMNLSLLDTKGELLIVSQFTLYADCKKGRRPSFINAAPPQKAFSDFDIFVEIFSRYHIRVETGIFGAMMNVELINNGPVTIILDSEEMMRSSGKIN